MQFPFDFEKKIVLRTPLYSFNPDISEEKLFKFFEQPLAKEALYIASPALIQEIERLKNEGSTDEGKKNRLRQSLLKYYNRMHTRCTPFGLFSTVTSINWGDASLINLAESLKRFTRFDMHYLCALAKYIESIPEVRNHLKFFPNSSLYQFNDRYRYIEYYYIDGNRSHQISEVDYSDFLDEIFQFTSEGVKIKSIAQFITDEEVNFKEAFEFTEELIEGQLLCSELEFTLTGENYAFRFLNILKEIAQKSENQNIQHIFEVVDEVLKEVSKVDHNPTNKLETYQKLISRLETIDVTIDTKRLFQVDAARDSFSGTVEKDIQKSIKQSIFALTKLTSQFEHITLNKFKEEFTKRYEDKEMPLMQVLDGENGIGYGEQSMVDDSLLTKDIVFPNSNDFKLEHVWDDVEQWKIMRLNQALALAEKEVIITDEDLKQFANKEKDLLRFPPSVSVIFSLLKNNELRIENVGNPSALNLLARFAHCNQEIEDSLISIATKEQELNKNVIFAEIVHLPEDRIGNIVQRPILRKYEIPYLARSNVKKEEQISLNDLMISVRWNRIFLRSKRLNMEIVPKLGNAHNFSMKGQPIYRFLADLQFQDVLPSVQFSWSKIDFMYPYLPRVKYKNCILSPTRWFFQTKEVNFLQNKDWKIAKQLFVNFKLKHSLPQYFLLADGDNELFINSEDDLSFEMFYTTIKKRNDFSLIEFLEPSHIVKTNTNNWHTHQFVLSLTKNKPTYTHLMPDDLTITKAFEIQQKFSIGDNWLYFKIYTGVKTSDRILKECISPMVEKLKTLNLISKWFFIRYNDPDAHLRIRFLVDDPSNTSKVIEHVKNFLNPFEQSGQIWKVAMDTYIREINRYGKTSIEFSELIFQWDSENALEMLLLTELNEYPNHYHWIFGILMTESMLDAFKVSLEQKVKLFDVFKDQFAMEFKIDKMVKKSFSQKHRTFSNEIDQFLSKDHEHPFTEILKQKTEKLKPICSIINELKEKGDFTLNFNGYLMSHIHMIFNRLIPDNQRKHELVIYDLMYKHYKTKFALSKKEHPKVSNQLVF